MGRCIQQLAAKGSEQGADLLARLDAGRAAIMLDTYARRRHAPVHALCLVVDRRCRTAGSVAAFKGTGANLMAGRGRGTVCRAGRADNLSCPR